VKNYLRYSLTDTNFIFIIILDKPITNCVSEKNQQNLKMNF